MTDGVVRAGGLLRFTDGPPVDSGMIRHGSSTIEAALAPLSDAELLALIGLVSAADRLPYFTGSGTAALATFTAAARALLDDPDAATMLTTLGAQPVDSDLTAIAALTTTAFGRGLLTLADAAALRTAAALGTIATQAANSVAITGGSVTGITDLAIADGGTGASTAAAALTNLGIGSIASAWSSFTPTLSNITLGNGTLVGAQRTVGKTVDFTFNLLVGSTTSFTGAQAGFNLPATTLNRHAFSAYYLDSGTRHWVGTAKVDSGTTLATLHHSDSSGTGGVTSTAPFTWAVNDLIVVTGSYQST